MASSGGESRSLTRASTSSSTGPFAQGSRFQRRHPQGVDVTFTEDGPFRTVQADGTKVPAGERARGSYRGLADALEAYPTAKSLLDNAEPHVLYSPPSPECATSVMEPEKRELIRRTDVGARWSIPGIANLLRLRLAKRNNPDDYARVWSPFRKLARSLVPQG